MIPILKFSGRLVLALFLFALLAEGAASFILPKPAVHRLPMIRFVTDPDCGFHPAPNQKAYTLSSPVTINKWGFRGKDWNLEKPPGIKRVAILGSSYAFGHGVGDEDFFPARLEKILNEAPGESRYEVLSFGVGGFDTGHEVEVLKAHALKFRPDIVVTAFFINDIFYIKDYGFYEEMFSNLEAGFNLRKWQFINLFRHSRLAMYFWDKFKEGMFGRGPGEVERAIQEYAIEGVEPPAGSQGEGWLFVRQKLKDFSALSAQHYFRPLLAVIPTYQEMSVPHSKNYYVRYLKDIAQSHGIPFIAMLDVFKRGHQNLNSLIIPYDLHLSAQGHNEIAKALASEILKTEISGAKAP